ncbi:MAG: methyltransferase domain-containing protein [Flavobacterium sp.]|nr:MAG: methyltransferase domain-containing protein [Flavobacterium sp.]
MYIRLKSRLKPYVRDFLKRIFNGLNFHTINTPLVGKIAWGDFNRVKPFSSNFGFDRGGAIDRYYIENFLASEASLIRGNVLEIADNFYSLKFGGSAITKSNILHLNENAPGATYIADLGQENNMPSDHFDCIILTQTLQYIYDFKLALNNCYRMLKSGGTLLLTVPGISPIEAGEWRKFWLWSFNEASMHKICAELFEGKNYTINSYGNVYAAISFLHGIGISEVDKAKLDVRDSAFDVVLTLRLTK